MTYHIEHNEIQAQTYRQLGCRPDWTKDPWLHNMPEVGNHVLCRDIHLQKDLHRRLKRLEILNIQPRFAVSRFLNESFFVVAVAEQINATTSTGFGYKACLEQATLRLQATPLYKKFEI